MTRKGAIHARACPAVRGAFRELAFRLSGQQIRYLSVQPQKADIIQSIEFVKGPDRTAPVVMAVTIESR